MYRKVSPLVTQANNIGGGCVGKELAKKKNDISICSSAAEYLTYVASVGEQEDSIEMRYEDENIWLTQKMMATLYGVDVRTISDHIKKIYSDSELEESATIRKFRIVQTEGSRQVQRETNHYNLQMIIAVGFKVNNERAVQFRKWANRIVKDYTITSLSERLQSVVRSRMYSFFLFRFLTNTSLTGIWCLPVFTQTEPKILCCVLKSTNIASCFILPAFIPIALSVVFQHANNTDPFCNDFLDKRLVCKPGVHKDIVCLYPSCKGIMDHLYCRLRLMEDSILTAFIACLAFIDGIRCGHDPLFCIGGSHHIEACMPTVSSPYITL